MIILSQAFLLSPGVVPLNTPVFGWANMATTVTATTEAAGFPASNLTNPSTALRWVADPGSPVADEYLTVDLSGTDDVDYVAVAVHNFGTGQNTLSVEYLDTSVSPDAWEELVEEHILANHDPVLFRFTPDTYQAIRLRIQPSPLLVPTIPFAAVMHVGKLLVMPRGTHTDHTPINLNIQTNVMNGRSETGNFLGRVVLSEGRSTSIPFQRLDQSWYRTYMHPFIIAAKADPFFFAWKPQEFQRDVGYCWLTNDPQPSRHFDTGTMALTLNMGGVAVG
jgi:hypothetical protein